jgi:hypothetical protein
MLVWIWNGSTHAWMPGPLPADRPYPLGASTTLIPLAHGGCAVLTRERLRVNGELVLPLRVLEDRDEVQRPGDLPFYVSIDDVPEVAPYSGGPEECRCARCGSLLVPGSPSIRCPRCLCVVHATETLRCWEFAPVCPACPQPTSGRSWEPEPLALPPGREIGADHA